MKEISDDLSGKMDKNNPYGKGSFSLNRVENSSIGKYSVAMGDQVVATRNSQSALGAFNDYEKEEYIITEESYIFTSSGQSYKVYAIDSYSFDSEKGVFVVENPRLFNINTNTSSGQYFVRPTQSGELPENITKVCKLIKFEIDRIMFILRYYNYEISLVADSNSKGKYLHMIGNGVSDTERSNAHTLDWEGNAWYAGDVYVKGSDQDDIENAKKLATEDYVNGKVATDLEVIEALAESGVVNPLVNSEGLMFTDDQDKIYIL